jgi:branched-subunit amino acid ABC-type transport system permease component
MGFFLQLLLNGVSTGFLYGISAIGFILIYRSGGLLNFAHGGMMSFGAFLFFALSVQADWPIILSFAVTLAGSFASWGFSLKNASFALFSREKPDSQNPDHTWDWR